MTLTRVTTLPRREFFRQHHCYSFQYHGRTRRVIVLEATPTYIKCYDVLAQKPYGGFRTFAISQIEGPVSQVEF